jgi:tRNA modification GTPase
MTNGSDAPPAETIFALSSGPGPSGVAVIRLSGPRAGPVLTALAGRLPPARVATLARLRDAAGAVLDEALVLYFPEGASFTGETVAELHVHGGRAVVRAVMAALAATPGLRFAAPGEFARRAFENGKLDLPQVESLAALVAAETESQRRQALRGVAGTLGRHVDRWRSLLLEAKALVAAAIDFSDEGDTAGAEAAIRSPLAELERELQSALTTAERGRIIADGFRVAIVGRPNAGKSSLLNRLAGSDVAIVTEHAGTTRDVIDVRLDLAGHAVILQDTAGLREADDPVEVIGIARARTAAASADLLLWVDEQGSFSETEWPAERPTIRVRTKSDQRSSTGDEDLALSAKTGEGIDSLLKRIIDHLASLDRGEEPLVSSLRQQEAIRAAAHSISAAVVEPLDRIEFMAEHLWDAERALDELVGRIGVEETLGAIFSRFCIGK